MSAPFTGEAGEPTCGRDNDIDTSTLADNYFADYFDVFLPDVVTPDPAP